MTAHKLKLTNGIEMTVMSAHKNIEDLKKALTIDKGWMFL
jgi:hypothetical protein